MESIQSVHGRITYRRAESVIDQYIEHMNNAKSNCRMSAASIEKLQFAIEALQDVRTELEWRDACHYWPSPL